jgi:hypothetical protein
MPKGISEYESECDEIDETMKQEHECDINCGSPGCLVCQKDGYNKALEEIKIIWNKWLEEYPYLMDTEQINKFEQQLTQMQEKKEQ